MTIKIFTQDVSNQIIIEMRKPSIEIAKLCVANEVFTFELLKICASNLNETHNKYKRCAKLCCLPNSLYHTWCGDLLLDIFYFHDEYSSSYCRKPLRVTEWTSQTPKYGDSYSSWSNQESPHATKESKYETAMAFRKSKIMCQKTWSVQAVFACQVVAETCRGVKTWSHFLI